MKFPPDNPVELQLRAALRHAHVGERALLITEAPGGYTVAVVLDEGAYVEGVGATVEDAACSLNSLIAARKLGGST